MQKFKITPSIYTANTLKLKEELELLVQAGIDQIHFDVMDGNYVNNYGFGTKQFQEIKALFPKLKIDVHMMANNISSLLSEFQGADYITFHFKSQQSQTVDELINLIHQHGSQVGLAIDLDDNLDEVLTYLAKIDLLTVMSIKPGFTGQDFDPTTWVKLQTIKNYLKEHYLKTKVEVDGGVRWTNLKQLIDIECDFIVVGSLIFKEKNYSQTMQRIAQL